MRLKLERELENRKMELAEALDEEQRNLEFQRGDLATIEEKRHNLSRHLENAIESFDREQADKDNLIDAKNAEEEKLQGEIQNIEGMKQ